MKALLIFILLCCGHLLFSQKIIDTVQQKRYKNYDVNLKSTSLDSKWLSFYKLYDDNSDTLVVVNRENPVQHYQKVKVVDYQWSKDRLIIKYKNRTEVFDYSKNKHWDLPACHSFGVIKNENVLALYNSGKVMLYDLKNEQLINTVDFVSKAFFRDNTIVLQVKNGADYNLFELRKNGKIDLYKTSYEVLNVKLLKDQSFLIFEKEDNHIQDIVYYNGLSKKIFRFSEILKPQFNSATGYQRGDGSIIIDAETAKVKRLNEEPEIWLSSDNNLLEKFKNSDQSKFLWSPEEKSIIKLGSQEFEKIVDINNENYFLAFSVSDMQDYTTKQVSSKVYRYNKTTNEFKCIDIIKEDATYSPDGQNLIYKKNDFWKLLNINTLDHVLIKNNSFSSAYFTDKNKILFDGEEGLWEYDIERRNLALSFKNEEGFYKIIKYDYSTNLSSNLFELTFRCRSLKESNFMFEIFDQSNLSKSIYEKFYKRYYPLIQSSASKLIYQKPDRSEKSYLFAEENYNLPKQFVDLSRLNKKNLIYRSNIGDKVQSDFRLETIQYSNSENVNLKGTLYYPLNYNPAKKYPMIVHVYQIQSDKRNYYPLFLEQNIDVGFDLRTLLEKGYFVYMPDIVFDSKGTGISALDCVNKSLDAISQYNFIDFKKIGLIGHSHGGYITNFIATQSNRFATYVSSAGNSDIVRSYYSMNYHYMSPYYWQFEGGQYQIFKPFTDDKDLYFRNSPIYKVENVSKPILLWAGKNDANIEWGQVMEFYIGLKRHKKTATMLLYPDEGHYIIDKKKAKDLHKRVNDWFDYYLKGEKRPSWID